MSVITRTVGQLKKEKMRLQDLIGHLDSAIKALGGRKGRHYMSAAGRRRISIAQRKYWAMRRKNKASAK